MTHLKTVFRTKYLYVLMLFILSSAAGFSQPWYFNKIYNPNETWSGGLCIIGTETGNFGCTVTGDSISNYFYQTAAFVFNNLGEINSWKNYGKDGCDYYPGDEGGLVQNGECFGLFGSVDDYLTSLSYGLFYKFDTSGDTILTRIFTSDLDTLLIGRFCIATDDGGFCLLGNIYGNNDNKEIILIKIDNNGNEMWRSRLGSDSFDWVKSLIQTADHGYAIGSWRYSAGYDPSTYDPVIIKTDSLGNYEWELNLGGPYADDEPMLCNAQDSCIIAITTYGDSMLAFTAAKARTNIIKINLSGEILWNHKFTTNDKDNHSSSIITLENGDYMACGYSWAATFHETSWLFRFSSTGDSLWFRDYYYYYGENYLYAVNQLFDVSSTEDHGFIATGQAYTSEAPNNIQKMWVLKVDSVGCEIENCWVGIEEDNTTVGLYDGKKGGLEIWPNPAAKIVNCQLSNVDGQIKSSTFNLQYSITVYDIYGREMISELLSSTRMGGGREGGLTIDVSALPPGIYFVVVRDERSVIGTGKFVVAR